MSISTEGLARVCAGHPKRTLAAWLVAVLVSFVLIALLLGDALTSDGDVTSNPESKQAEALIRESFPPEPTPSEIVVVRSDRYTVDEPAFQAKVRDTRPAREGTRRRPEAQVTTPQATRRLSRRIAMRRWCRSRSKRRGRSARRFGHVGGRTGWLPGLDHRLPDGRRRLREALRGRPAEGRAPDRAACGADRSRARVRRGRGGPRAGPARAAVDRDRSCLDRSRRPGLRGLVLRREHDHRDGPSARDRLCALHPLPLPGRARHGLEKVDAIVASGATASRAVLFSGMAFVLAMFGMLLVPDTILRSLALGAILVGIVSVLAALTLLPAVLSLLGDRVNALRIPSSAAGQSAAPARRPLLVGARARRHAAAARESCGCDGAPARFYRSRTHDRHRVLGAQHAARPLPVQAGLRRAEPRLPRRRGRPGPDRRPGRRLLGTGSVGDRGARDEPCRRGRVRPGDAGDVERR